MAFCPLESRENDLKRTLNVKRSSVQCNLNLFKNALKCLKISGIFAERPQTFCITIIFFCTGNEIPDEFSILPKWQAYPKRAIKECFMVQKMIQVRSSVLSLISRNLCLYRSRSKGSGGVGFTLTFYIPRIESLLKEGKSLTFRRKFLLFRTFSPLLPLSTLLAFPTQYHPRVSFKPDKCSSLLFLCWNHQVYPAVVCMWSVYVRECVNIIIYLIVNSPPPKKKRIAMLWRSEYINNV